MDLGGGGHNSKKEKNKIVGKKIKFSLPAPINKFF
jgi:hypothetical protein